MKRFKFYSLLFISALAISIIIFIVGVFILKREIYINIETNDTIRININDNLNIPNAEVTVCNKHFKKYCKNITKNLEITNNVDTSKIGKYEIKYYVKYKKTEKINTLEVSVEDLEKPTIILNDNSKKNLCPNYDLNNLKDYVVSDNYDTDLNEKVTKYIKNNKLYYSITDSHGNKNEVSIDVEIKDKDKPSITLNGYEDVYILQGTEYVESGFTAYDNCDGNLTNNVKKTGSIDITKTGDYEIKYSVQDSSGNETTKIRKIHIYNHTIGENIKKNGKVVYLTFDDGPNSYTKNVLDVLNKYQVKATFFVTNQFPKYQFLIKDMYQQGHRIAIHTYSHDYKKIYKSEESYLEDLNKMDNIIYEQTGIHSKLIRFPGGGSNTISKFNPGIMTRLSNLLKDNNYVYFDWNVDSNDTRTIDSNKIANTVINGMKNNKDSIVLMHDIKYANKAALEKIIYYGLTNGYTFLPLDENSPTAHHHINN